MKLRPGLAIAVSAVIVAVAYLPDQAHTRIGSGPTSLGGITLTAAPVSPGPPQLSNSKAGLPILAARGGLAAGKPLTGNVVIANQSNAPLTVSLNQQNLTTGPAG